MTDPLTCVPVLHLSLVLSHPLLVMQLHLGRLSHGLLVIQVLVQVLMQVLMQVLVLLGRLQPVAVFLARKLSDLARKPNQSFSYEVYTKYVRSI